MPSSVTQHTIPSFYACYFLRSLASPGITYIGSTPAPPRRKRQHNGDLTQGAYKTARARPWEMECIVYGFSSKIAALQFEWAWAKPNLTRHLKFLSTEHSIAGDTTDTSEWAGKSLFPSTSMTPGQTRWGKPKRRIARPPSTPNARLLAMRALLRSEPFCGWGLKLAFFTEWSWLAYQRLEAAASTSISIEPPSTLLVNRYSRSGKLLPPYYPLAVCDFAGVDGKRVPLVHVSAQHCVDAGVAYQPVKKRQSSSKKKADADEPLLWPETLPRSANLKGLDACIQDFDTFPSSRAAATNTDLTRKAKRTTKASKEAIVDATDDIASDVENEDLDTDPAAVMSAAGFASTPPLHRMRFDDLDLEESEWKRFESLIHTRVGSASTTAAMRNFMQTCVQRHIAAQDARTRDDAVSAPTAACALCDENADLSRQLDFVLCPSPHTSTLPVTSRSNSDAIDVADSGHSEDVHCNAVYHLSCLANSFLRQQQSADQEADSSTNTVLPTHGSCPSCTGAQKQVGTWADVVRGMYRRHERFRRLLQLLVKSGKSLAEHLEPPPSAAEAKASKMKRKGRAVATAEEANGEAVGGGNGVQTASKAARTRKRTQPSVGDAGAVRVASSGAEEAKAEAKATEGVAKRTTKRKTSKKVEMAGSTEVIDLT